MSLVRLRTKYGFTRVCLKRDKPMFGFFSTIQHWLEMISSCCIQRQTVKFKSQGGNRSYIEILRRKFLELMNLKWAIMCIEMHARTSNTKTNLSSSCLRDGLLLLHQAHLKSLL